MSLTFFEKGTGTPLILLHGFCENKTIWNPFIDSLAKDFRVVSFDLPGFGENKPVKEITIEQAADEVADALKLLKIEKCVMVGHSLGGYVSLAFAEKYAQYLLGFGLFHSSALEDDEEKKNTRNKTADFIKKNGMRLFSQSFVEPLFFPKYRQSLKEPIEKLKEEVAQCSADSVVAYTYAMRDRKERIEVLKSVQVPVLFVVGKNDQAVPLEASLKQCYLPKNAMVQFLDETAHMGMIERPDETYKIIKYFTTYCS